MNQYHVHTRLQLLRFCLIGLVALMWTCLAIWQKAGAAEPDHPNIVFVFADDLGWGDVSCYNAESKITTPNIDRLASQGIRFTDAHAAGATCAPSRFGLITGRSPAVWSYGSDSKSWNCKTMPKMLQEAGYFTVCIGKWHFKAKFESETLEGYRKPFRLGPLDRGFDLFYGSLSQPAARWSCHADGDRLIDLVGLTRSGRPLGSSFDHQDWHRHMLEKTREVIAERAGKPDPFLVYFALNAPHEPLIPDEQFKGKSSVGKYGDYCLQVDWILGEVVKAIEDNGIADNTIVIFSSDNGSHSLTNGAITPAHGHAPNGPWRGSKSNAWEGGHRIPYIVRWPGQIEPGSVSDMPVSLLDHFATFAAIVGYQPKEHDGADSWNILPFWKGETSEDYKRTRLLPVQSLRSNCLRVGQWKIIPGNLGGGGFKKTEDPESGFIAPGPEGPQGLLYHLTDDPGERENLWLSQPETLARMRRAMETFKTRKATAPHALQQP